ncbi:fatty acid/phospholipid synthesis protein [Plesiocystis pacifica SIR-1]|uniref:Phosphate acyltransferase n=1 Tax=Plesiocystis pacifica SIR-1 TaxID=391625 RepID=A6G9T7_9BACT|nr:fatty acid/phospholipid synthesis protein [Plesiocystis pacifica]EDM77373.1 fatty acid/phospholipid synthesis protein [Plesiocystis pacifica SIR-1]
MPTAEPEHRVALDAHGSDGRPGVEVAAAILAAEAALGVDLVGDRSRLEPALREALDARARAAKLDGPAREALEAAVAERVAIVHASQEIAMDESPARAVRAKPEASLCVAIARARGGGPCVGAVSAGNSGALLAAGTMGLGRYAGVDRPAILTAIPQVTHGAKDEGSRGDSRASSTAAGPSTLLLDAGANVRCRPLNLVQFAVLGAVHASARAGREAGARPRVAVLANGTEAGKGTELTRTTHDLLSAHSSPSFEFVGYVEPAQLFGPACDVAVTDGWTGNITLKVAEAAMAAWPQLLREALRGNPLPAPARSALAAVRGRVDPNAHGGAPLVGVDGTLIICHGASEPRALVHAVNLAGRYARAKIGEASREALAAHRELFAAASSQRLGRSQRQ